MKKKITINKENIVDFLPTISSQEDILREIKNITDQYLKSSQYVGSLIKILKDSICHLSGQHNFSNETKEIIGQNIDFLKNNLETSWKNFIFELETIKKDVTTYPTEHFNEYMSVKADHEITNYSPKENPNTTTLPNDDLSNNQEKITLNLLENKKQKDSLHRDSHRKKVDVLANMKYLNKELNKKIKN